MALVYTWRALIYIDTDRVCICDLAVDELMSMNKRQVDALVCIDELLE